MCYMMVHGLVLGVSPTAAMMAAVNTSCTPSWDLDEHSTYLGEEESALSIVAYTGTVINDAVNRYHR